jgi:threonine synthase
MRYFSTRGQTPICTFTETVAQGLAPDGGLYLPDTIPNVIDKLRSWQYLSYSDLCFAIFELFATDLSSETLHDISRHSFINFTNPHIAPLLQLDEKLFVLELFHGPTLSFKDYALQLLGNLYQDQIQRTGIPINILGATSGDTGSAAISGALGKPGIKTFILYPKGRIAPLQELQMTSTGDPNVFPIAIQGTFDNCQSIVKEIFNDLPFKSKHHLSAVNSLNWARLVAQIVYYFYAWIQLPATYRDTAIEIAVPSGNFGNAFAGWFAQQMGLPIQTLRIATNQNDILYRLFTTNKYQQHHTHASLAPSMDIQASSNFERFLYYEVGQNPETVRTIVNTIRETGTYDFTTFNRSTFRASHADDARILKNISMVYEKYHYVIDPHTACAFEDIDPNKTTIILSTAHPAKFTKALKDSIGQTPTHPTLESLKNKTVHNSVLPANIDDVKLFIKSILEK